MLISHSSVVLLLIDATHAQHRNTVFTQQPTTLTKSDTGKHPETGTFRRTHDTAALSSGVQDRSSHVPAQLI